VLRQAAADRSPALIESTAAQVNLEGGYSGLTPRRFREEVQRLAAAAGIDAQRLILGGDHIGPHPWRQDEAGYAVDKAAELAAACARAGYQKLHLDTATTCRGDPHAADGTLEVDIVSRRAARLCQAAEEGAATEGLPSPWYVIGSDVPPPGGERTGAAPPPSDPAKLEETIAAHRRAFQKAGLAHAWRRVFAVVVHTGADFSPRSVRPYDTRRVQPLVARIRREGLVFEAHSTDFQRPEALSRMVADRFGILKVGPALTFAMREALFALAAIESAWLADRAGVRVSRLPDVMDRLMREDPTYWRAYYPGTAAEQADLRRRAYSDRIRYYWFHPRARSAVRQLMRNLQEHPPPGELIDQHLPEFAAPIREGRLSWDPGHIVLERIGGVAKIYARACRLSPH
jgi:D-tagatose-1,6-bisphosphate aldolase subunit GatZ/KbaZ